LALCASSFAWQNPPQAPHGGMVIFRSRGDSASGRGPPVRSRRPASAPFGASLRLNPVRLPPSGARGSGSNPPFPGFIEPNRSIHNTAVCYFSEQGGFGLWSRTSCPLPPARLRPFRRVLRLNPVRLPPSGARGSGSNPPFPGFYKPL
jgi:hypothetical protein